ncbi:hypothetical protein RINTHH_9100 [Richelia intracellularis HH01]|uniref:Uncharacterized protein n=1 Tax=Richelia intracellularis HH01 TaxID=1165094 RepID=M1X2M1_9NOST|nr:hypothetical protein [Richelia intracellularis]CCH67065.1 hypothetical protein RINTHH_9100 [Richelia intracellularis HH01]
METDSSCTTINIFVETTYARKTLGIYLGNTYSNFYFYHVEWDNSIWE